MGFYGKLCDFTVKHRILQENICYFTGDYRILRDIYIGFLREMTGFNRRLLQVSMGDRDFTEFYGRS